MTVSSDLFHIIDIFVCTKYNMSDHIVSDLQCRADGETFYIRYITGANIVLWL